VDRVPRHNHPQAFVDYSETVSLIDAQVLEAMSEYQVGRPLPTEAMHGEDLKRLATDVSRKFDAALAKVATNVPLRKPFPRIRLAVCDSLDINAFAFRHIETYYIAITYGLVVQCYIMFGHLLTSPKVLPAIGDPGGEVGIRVSLPYSMSALPALQKILADPSVHRQAFPRCGVRGRFSNALTLLALEFVVRHELRHVLAGHVDYGLTALGVTRMAEVGGRLSGNQASLAMEMDADSYGVTTLLRWLLSAADHPPDRNPLLALASSTVQTAVSSGLIPPYMVLRWFGDEVPVPAELDGNDHPPARMRQVMLGSVAGTWALGLNRPEVLQAILADRDTIPLREKVFAEMVGSESRLDSLVAASLLPFGEYQRLLDYWVTIESDIERFSYVSFDGLREARRGTTQR